MEEAVSGAKRATATRAAWLALPILTVIWSLNWTVMKVALNFSGPFTFSMWRYVTGTIAVFALLLARRERLVPPPWKLAVLIGLTQTAAFQAFSEWALVRGGAGKTALFAYTMPFWVVGLAWWWLHEKPGAWQLAAIVLAALGLLAVIAPWQRIGDPGSVVLAVVGGLCWAIGTVLSKRVFLEHPEVTPAQLTAWTMLIGTIALVVLAFLIPERPVSWTPEYILAIAYNGVLTSAVGWVFWALIVQRLPTNVAGLTSLAVPVASVLFAWLLLAERPSSREWLGIILIGLALLGLNFARGARPAAKRCPAAKR